MPQPTQPAAAIEGSFRVVSTRDVPLRKSPNRRRAVARIVLWNLAGFAAVLTPFILR